MTFEETKYHLEKAEKFIAVLIDHNDHDVVAIRELALAVRGLLEQVDLQIAREQVRFT